MASTGKTAALFMTSATTTLVFQRTVSSERVARLSPPDPSAASVALDGERGPAVPSWRRWAEAAATSASFALLAFVLLGCWLALMQGNGWI